MNTTELHTVLVQFVIITARLSIRLSLLLILWIVSHNSVIILSHINSVLHLQQIMVKFESQVLRQSKTEGSGQKPTGYIMKNYF